LRACNMELSCRPVSVPRLEVLRTYSVLTKQDSGGQLQRFVMFIRICAFLPLDRSPYDPVFLPW
jgi:hypothetical protein